MSVYKFLLGAAAASIAVAPAHAQNTVWKCVAEDGRPHYTNVQLETKGQNCTVVSREVSVIPAHKPAPSKSASAAPTPSSFPRVDSETQKSRDDNRRKILEEELSAEERALAEAKAKLTEQESIREGGERNYQKVLDRLQPFKDSVAQHERNVQALQKEISSLK